MAKLTPQGRWRVGDFRCAIGEIEQVPLQVEPPRCAPHVLDPVRPSVIEEDPVSHPPIPREACVWGSAVACGTHFGGDARASLLLCRDAAARVDGPIELIGSDGSLLEQMFCDAGTPVGPQVVWRKGAIFSVTVKEGGAPLGVSLIENGYKYWSPRHQAHQSERR